MSDFLGSDSVYFSLIDILFPPMTEPLPDNV